MSFFGDTSTKGNCVQNEIYIATAMQLVISVILYMPTKLSFNCSVKLTIIFHIGKALHQPVDPIAVCPWVRCHGQGVCTYIIENVYISV